MGHTFTFQDFLASVDAETQRFVTELHEELTNRGCKTEVKLAKSGYVVSYSLNQKTISNYVFRKKGLMVRIYASHIAQFMDVLETLPDDMVRAIQKASDCKRLKTPTACNPKCSMGYEILLRGERLQKCRNSAFLFLLTKENQPFVRTLLLSEVASCVSGG